MRVVSEAREISQGLSVVFEFDTAQPAIQTRWTPALPSKLSHDELARYRVVRDEFLKSLAATVGGAVLCMEL